MTRNGVLSMSLTVGTMNLAKHGSPLWVAIEKNTGLFAFAEDEVAAAERLRKVVTITLDTAMTQGAWTLFIRTWIIMVFRTPS